PDVDAMSHRKRVVILGGGIAGLTAGWRLAKKAPTTRLNITILEASSRVGGWLQSNVIPEVATFESGPRSLRPVGVPGLATLELVIPCRPVLRCSGRINFFAVWWG
ncbi:hypothetical protein L0F63_005546, partial [Massospora cicadina]